MLSLLYGLGVLNDQDQTEEEVEKVQFEKRQARVQAQLIAVAVSHTLRPQDNPKGSGRFTHPSGGKTNKGKCFKCKSTHHQACGCQEPLGHAQPAKKPGSGEGSDLGSKWERGFCSWDGHAGQLRCPQGFQRLPSSPKEMSISIEESCVVLFFFFFFCTECRKLFPWTGMEPESPALEVESLKQWITREFPLGGP